MQGLRITSKLFLLIAALLLVQTCCRTAHAEEAMAQEAAMISGSNASEDATLQVKMSQLQEELRQLRGKIEELQYQNSKLSDNLDKLRQDYEFRLGELEKKVGAAAPAASSTQNEIDQALTEEPSTPVPAKTKASKKESTEGDVPLSMQNGSSGGREKVLGTMKMGKDEKISTTVAQPVKPSVEKPAVITPEKPAKLGAKEQYDAAFGLLKEKKYNEAINALEDFASKNRKDPLAANAIYWAGEAYYVQGNYTDAARKFVESYKKSPKGQKAPDSLLKLSMALAKLDQKKQACTTLEELNSKFPKTSAAIKKKAATEKKSYGCK